MNRIIKFRAWHLGKMYYPDELKPKFYMNLDGEIVRSYDDQVLSNQFELMQFTGLTDKNGVLIYEGDMVDNWGEDGQSEIMEVMFNDVGQWMWGDGRGNSLPLYELDMEETVVIGNIYENPELLT